MEKTQLDKTQNEALFQEIENFFVATHKAIRLSEVEKDKSRYGIGEQAWAYFNKKFFLKKQLDQVYIKTHLLSVFKLNNSPKENQTQLLPSKYEAYIKSIIEEHKGSSSCGQFLQERWTVERLICPDTQKVKWSAIDVQPLISEENKN